MPSPLRSAFRGTTRRTGRIRFPNWNRTGSPPRSKGVEYATAQEGPDSAFTYEPIRSEFKTKTGRRLSLRPNQFGPDLSEKNRATTRRLARSANATVGVQELFHNLAKVHAAELTAYNMARRINAMNAPQATKNALQQKLYKKFRNLKNLGMKAYDVNDPEAGYAHNEERERLFTPTDEFQTLLKGLPDKTAKEKRALLEAIRQDRVWPAQLEELAQIVELEIARGKRSPEQFVRIIKFDQLMSSDLKYRLFKLLEARAAAAAAK